MDATVQDNRQDRPLRIYTEPIEHESTRTMRLMLWGAFIALLLVPVVTLIDIPIARWFASDPLPSDVDQDKTRATYKGGVLTIVLPKSKEAQPRIISIS